MTRCKRTWLQKALVSPKVILTVKLQSLFGEIQPEPRHQDNPELPF